MVDTSTYHRIAGRRIVIAGGSGFLGLSLGSYLAKQGASVTIISRSRPNKLSDFSWIEWDGRNCGNWKNALDGADALVNLAGRTVDCIKTAEHCDEILRSRVESTLALGAAIRQIDRPPPVWVQMATAHIYGDPPVERCVEDSALGYGLAPIVGKAWETAFENSKLEGQRGVLLRTGFVLGKDRGAGSGALGRLRWLTRLGLGGTVGHGRQGMSWLHELDINRIFVRAICDEQMTGVYIASGPNPVSQRDFARALRRAMHIPIGLPAFEWMVRLGAPLVLKTDPELALYGRYVVPQRLLNEGFQFTFPTLDDALNDCLSTVDQPNSTLEGNDKTL